MLVVLTTHPIQYQVPLWQGLAADGRIPFEVWYLTDHGTRPSYDREFGRSFAWDLDTLSGYQYRFLDVRDGAAPGSFWGCRLREKLGDTLQAIGAKALWVQGWQVAAYWQAVRAAKSVRVQVWLRAESNDFAPVALWKRPVKRLLLGSFFERVDEFLYIGQGNRSLYRRYGVPEHRLHPAPYAVANERFAAQAWALAGKRSELRRRWGIPEHAFCVLFAGKFIPKKRPLDLVRAATLLKTRASRPLHLLFVGSGELGSHLRAACKVVFDADSAEAPEVQLRARDSDDPRPCASFSGFLNQRDISTAYVAADCLALPSDFRETWGLVVNEAMASGLPCVISSQCGSSLDLGAACGNAVYCGGDVHAFAAALARTMERRIEQDVPSASAAPPSIAETIDTVVALSSRIGIVRN